MCIFILQEIINATEVVKLSVVELDTICNSTLREITVRHMED